MSYKINKIITIPETPFKQSIDLQLIKLCETITPFRPISYLQYKKLKPKAGKLRFLIEKAFNERDK